MTDPMKASPVDMAYMTDPMKASPVDMAYMKGFADGFDNVTYLTRRLYGAYVCIGLMSIVIVWLVVGRTNA